MTKNPSIQELSDTDKYELIATLEHKAVKEFVVDQITSGGKVAKLFMIYQLLMLVTGALFLGIAVYRVFKNSPAQLYYSLGALAFSFSVLVVIHEWMHGRALKLTGAPRVNYGGNLRKFIFYAEADRHVLNGKQFQLVALTPLVLVKAICLAGIIIFYNQPIAYFFIILMCIHSLFCAGDIGLLGFFESHKDAEVYTYDNHQERKSYFFKRVKYP